jgi:putative colanic acid biosynthesis acetyltransferase WcaF
VYTRIWRKVVEVKVLDASKNASKGGASFTVGNRIFRVIWYLTWLVLASWTPPPFFGWRRFVLRVFGAKIGRGVRVYGSARIWYPPNLVVGDFSVIGPRVNCYNQGSIAIGDNVVVSQGAHLCASTHDFRDYHFQLVLCPIRINSDAWVAADAFVGPGVTVGEGAVLGARAVLARDASPWSIYVGNPANRVGDRVMDGTAKNTTTKGAKSL